ncbi:MAG: gliding motility-associated C-terminal domain-containing protein [Ginsengibacter sp.]
MKGLNYYLCLLLLLVSYRSFGQEICDNGKDDDGDGLIDLQDPDCQCHFNVTGNILKNASFELYNNCPTNYSYDNDYRIADSWQYGTYTNGNLADYYHNFNCTKDSSQVMLLLPPSLPLPDGKAFMSIRQYVYRNPNMRETDIAKVYISQCLQNTLTPGEQYTCSFSAGKFQSSDDRDFKFKSIPFTVAIFGHSDCNAVPFGPPNALSNGCPSNYPGWVLLGKTIVHSKGKWVQNRINFTAPPGISVIAIGPDCSILNPNIDLADSTTFLDYYVYYLDDLHLLPTKDFHFPVIQSQSGNACTADSVLTAPNISNAGYQWYKDSVAIAGATFSSFHIPKSNSTGNYNVRIITTDSCFVSEPFPVGINELLTLKLPADTSLCDTDTLSLAPALPGITYTWNGNRNSTVTIFQEGIYEIVATGVNGCSKKFTVTVHTQDCKIYIPNAFTPNGDGINDVFLIPQEMQMQLKEFLIFDRWGNNVFSTTNRNTGWDGSRKGVKSSPGTYLYIIKGTAGNKKIQLKGMVTLIR